MPCDHPALHGMKQRSKDITTIGDQLRERLAGERPHAAIAAAVGIPRSTLSRFISGQCGLALGTVERLCRLLDLELRERNAIKPRKPKEPDQPTLFS